jgi:hypothetical protein
VGAGVSFALDRYEPVAFHTHPELMRAAEASTAVQHPVGPPPMPAPTPTPQTVLTPSPAPESSPVSAPAAEPTPVSTPSHTPPAPAPPEPIAAYLVGMDATPLLRAQLADFLDAAGSRRDVRVSVGVAAGRKVSWVLRDQVPYGVRALPRYPDGGPASDPHAALAAAAAAVVADAAGDPNRRQLVVLLGDRPPEPVALPAPLRSALVLHCVDAVLSPPTSNGAVGSCWVLARSRPGPRPALLAHAGLLLDRWEAFADLPPGLWLGPLP